MFNFLKHLLRPPLDARCVDVKPKPAGMTAREHHRRNVPTLDLRTKLTDMTAAQKDAVLKQFVVLVADLAFDTGYNTALGYEGETPGDALDDLYTLHRDWLARKHGGGRGIMAHPLTGPNKNLYAYENLPVEPRDGRAERCLDHVLLKL
jgi:hypothetical protein